LFSVLQNIVDSRPRVHYIVAVDDSKTKLQSIVKVMYLFWYLVSFIISCVLNTYILNVSDHCTYHGKGIRLTMVGMNWNVS